MMNQVVTQLENANQNLVDQCHKEDIKASHLQLQLDQVLSSKAFLYWQRYNRVKKLYFIHYVSNIVQTMRMLIGIAFKPVQAVLTSFSLNVAYSVKSKMNRCTPLIETKPKNCSVSILIPTFGNIDNLERLLHSIQKHSDFQHYEILVINDNPKASRLLCEWCKHESKFIQSLNVSIFTNSQNLGFCHSINFLSKLAKGQYLYFLNDDTEVISKYWITSLLDSLRDDENIAIAGSLLLFEDKTTVQHAGMHPYKKRDDQIYNYHYYKFFHHKYPDINQKVSVPMVTGASLMIKKKVFEELGRLDVNYFGAGGFDDSDLCNRAIRAGHLIYYIPNSKLIHFEGSTIKTMTKKHYLTFQHNHQYYQNMWRAFLEEKYPEYIS